jgi:hypothetical protein
MTKEMISELLRKEDYLLVENIKSRIDPTKKVTMYYFKCPHCGDVSECDSPEINISCHCGCNSYVQVGGTLFRCVLDMSRVKEKAQPTSQP